MKQQLVLHGQIVNYEQRGTGSPIIFLHGWRSSADVWAQTAAQFSEHELHLLNLPGFGGSPAPKSAWSVADYAAVVCEYIEKKNLKQVTIVGHSFGGRVGIYVSATKPELVSKLVLTGSAGFVMPAPKKKILAAVARMVRPLFAPRFMQPLRRSLYGLMGAEDYLATPELQQTFVKVVGEDLSGMLSKISAPTLLVWGAHDTDTPLSYGNNMHESILSSELVVLQNAGHFAFLDAPSEFVSAVKKFISK